MSQNPMTAADWDQRADQNAELARAERLGELKVMYQQEQRRCREQANQLREEELFEARTRDLLRQARKWSRR